MVENVSGAGIRPNSTTPTSSPSSLRGSLRGCQCVGRLPRSATGITAGNRECRTCQRGCRCRCHGMRAIGLPSPTHSFFAARFASRHSATDNATACYVTYLLRLCTRILLTASCLRSCLSTNKHDGSK